MAENKKIYTLQIQGTKESYEEIIKLNDVLESMDKTIQDVNKTEQELNKTKKESKQTTDELTKVQNKLREADSEYQKELARAKAALQEKNKAIKEELNAEKLVEGSYYAKQAALTKLGKDIKSYVATTEDEQATLEEMKSKYAELNAELKEFDGTMGNHQREVGNYQLAFKGLQEELEGLKQEMAVMLSEGVDPLSEGYQTLANRAGQIQNSIQQSDQAVQTFAANSKKINDVINIASSLTAGFGLVQSTMAAFGLENENVEKSIQQMMAAMTALNSLQQLSANITDKNSATYKVLNSIMSVLGLTKKTTTAATIAETAVTSANSVAMGANAVATTGASVATNLFSKALIATGIGAIVVLLGYLIANFDEVKKYVTELVPALGDMGDTFDQLKSVFMGVGEVIVQYITTPIRTIIAVVKGFMKDGIKGAIDAGTKEVKKGLDVVGNFEKGYNKQQEKNNLQRIKDNAKTLDKQLKDKLDNLTAQYGSDYKFTKDGLKLYKEFYANKKNMYDKDSDEYKKAVNEELTFLREVTEHEQKELKTRNDAAKKAADDRKKDLEKLKEDTKKILEDTTKLYADNEQARLDFAKKGIGDLNVLNQEQLEYKLSQLKKLNDEQDKLSQQSYDRELSSIKEQYDKLIKEAERLGQDTSKIKEDFENHKKGIEDKANQEKIGRDADLNKTIIDENNKLNEKLISNSKSTVDEINKTLDNQLKNIKTLNTKASKTGGYFNVIDVDKTKKDIQTAKQAYDDLAISLLEQGKIVATEYDDQLAKTAVIYGHDSKQYQDLLNQKTLALDKYLSDYTVANQASTDLQKQEGELMNQYWDSVSAQISDKFKMINEAVLTPMFDAFSALNDMALEDAQKNLEKVTKLHDKAVDQVTESQDRIQSLNDQIKNSNSLRRDELQKTLDDEMVMLKEREVTEQRLAIETQQAEEEVAKKQREQKKMDAGKAIIEAAINTAVAVTAALPNIALAAIVGVMGAASTALAAAQYAKLEDGGLLNGASHANGGMKIQGTNIEVEGGEYVVNRKSTAAYLPLLEAINTQGKSNTITTNNIYKTFENGGQLDYDLISNLVNMNNPYNKMNNKMDDMNNKPIYVAVTDINKGMDRVARVRDMAGAN